MRSTITSNALLAASLLVKDVLAGPPHQLRHKHRRDLVIDTVTDEVIDTVYQTVVVTVEGGQTEGVPAATTAPVSAAIVTVTPTSSVAVVESTPVASTPVAVASTAEAAVFAQQASISTSAAVTPTTLATVAKSSTTSTSSAAVVSASSSTTSSGKRGLAYNDADLLSGFSSSSEISWAYNWGSSSDGLSLSNVEYVPMLWGLNSASTDDWTTAADAAIASGSTYLMSFNEPDLDTQSNIGYADAAAGYLTYMEPYADKAKLLAPAVTNGGSPMGLTYLENFIGACSTCTIHAVNIHWYDSATNIDYFKTYVAEAYTAGGNLPVWISEFGASGSDDEVNTFLETVLPWLDEQDYVERYAYFMASDGVLLSSGTTLSTIGTTYAST